MSARADTTFDADRGRSPGRPRLVIALWLIFSAFPIIDLLGSDPPVGRAIVLLALALIFVGTYLYAMLARATRLPGPAGWNVLAPLLVATAALLAIDGSRWVPMAIFCAAAAGRRLPPRSAVWLIGLIALVAAGVTLADSDAGAALVIAVTAIGIGYWALGFTRALVQNDELRAAQAEIRRLAVADERLRFARDLHDLLGHSLSVITLKAELAGRVIDQDAGAAAAQVADIEAVSRRALADVRAAVAGYREPVLADEVEGARAALADAGVAVEVDADDVALPADAEAVLAWAVREGATNALRHAGARHVRIAVHADDREARVEVVDDGRGLDGTRDGAVERGFGLAGLAERAARARGRMDARPQPGGGFRLAVAVPVEVAR